MKKGYSLSIYLDTRRPLKNGLYPVKLKVYNPTNTERRYYPTEFQFTEEEFKSIWQTVKPRNELKEIRNKLNAIELKAVEVADKLKPFSFVQFEKKIFTSRGESNNVVYHYTEAINKLRSNNSHNTANNYQLALKSLIEFIKNVKRKEVNKIPFADITPDWLQDYENYMINKLKRSRTTVSIYIRTLRTIFNKAITDKDIDAEIYPFGKDKYQPPTVSNVKKAIEKTEMKSLYDTIPQTPEQQKAKDFWFFSYACNGMNIKDIALLKYENLQGDKFVFYRAKTINTSKTDLRPITVYLTDLSKEVINKYGNKDKSPQNYIFNILSNNNTELENHRAIKAFTRFINQHIKKLAVANNIPVSISTYSARHSFATNAVLNGASMEYVMEALNHSNLKTTINYFKGFPDEKKKEIAQKLVKF